MRELSNQVKYTLKGKLDAIEDDGTVRVITTGKNPMVDEENLESIKEDLTRFFESLSVTDKVDFSVIAKVVND